MTQEDRIAFSIAEAARELHMTPAAVREAIARGLLWAVTIDRATRVPADEVDRVRANLARRQPSDRRRSWQRRPKFTGEHAWTFERQAPRAR